MAAKKKSTAAVAAKKEADSGAVAILKQLGLSFSMQDGSNRYAMYDELGRGGVGLVYFGMDKALHREVAVKILRKRYLKDHGAVAHFLNEAKIMARLDHPGIVPVYDIGFMSDELFFSMERIEGQTLRQVLDERRSSKDVQRSLSDMVNIFERVCQIVAYAHSRGIVHRDLKPENIMVGEFNTVYVMDWGIARELSEEKNRNAIREIAGDGIDITALLNARKVKGTPKYMSPEQALGVTNVDYRSDVFSLGLILYEILGGKHPFEAESMREVMHRIKQKRTPAVSSYFVPNELKSICYKALEKLPEDRYATAASLAEDVHRSLSFQNVSVHRDNPVTWTWKLFRRHMVLSLVAASILTVAAVLFVTWFSGVRYSNKLLEMAEKRMINAEKCQRDIQAWRSLEGVDEEKRRHKVSKINARKNMILASARALFCAALKKQAHELSPQHIQALKVTWFAELKYHMQLDNVEGALETYREMEEDGFLRPDNPIMQWTPEEVEKIRGYGSFLKRQQELGSN